MRCNTHSRMKWEDLLKRSLTVRKEQCISLGFLFFEDEIHICNLHDIFIELFNDVGNRILHQLVWTRTVDQLYRKHL